MSATRKSNAGLHYTILTSANAVSIGIGGVVGGVLADHAGKTAAFAIAACVTLAPIALVGRWSRAAEASSRGVAP
jgi:predicted MFS family arabinose efflux permease